jgi:uncharacterized protein VirK/YbjX
LPLVITRPQLPIQRGKASPATVPSCSPESFSQGLKRDMADKGLTGSLAMVQRLLKVWARLPEHLGLLKVIKGATTRQLLAVYPRIAYRYSLPYLSEQFAWSERVRMMKAHYSLLNQVHGAKFFEQVLGRGFDLHTWSIAGRQFRLAMQGPCLVSRHREGDLCLVIQMDGQVLYRLAFSVIPTDVVDLPAAQSRGASPLALYVGHVQGKAGQIDRMREATGLCHDVAQQDLLMSALGGLAAAWGINRVVGVRDQSNLSQAYIAQSAASFQYESFWARYHAVLTEQGHHAMSLPFAEKPITEIAAKHRRRTLTKRQFKQSLAESVQQAVTQALSRSPILAPMR